MKHAPPPRLIDLPDDIGIDIAMIAISMTVAVAALAYLLTI